MRRTPASVRFPSAAAPARGMGHRLGTRASTGGVGPTARGPPGRWSSRPPAERSATCRRALRGGGGGRRAGGARRSRTARVGWEHAPRPSRRASSSRAPDGNETALGSVVEPLVGTLPGARRDLAPRYTRRSQAVRSPSAPCAAPAAGGAAWAGAATRARRGGVAGARRARRGARRSRRARPGITTRISSGRHTSPARGTRRRRSRAGFGASSARPVLTTGWGIVVPWSGGTPPGIIRPRGKRAWSRAPRCRPRAASDARDGGLIVTARRHRPGPRRRPPDGRGIAGQSRSGRRRLSRGRGRGAARRCRGGARRGCRASSARRCGSRRAAPP